MTLSPEELNELTHLAVQTAQEAGVIIQQFSKEALVIHQKKSGTTAASQIVTQADHLSQTHILSRLQPSITQYNLGLLSEEQPDNHSRLEKEYFWCIDPLDGTLPFTEGRSGYAVSIALVRKDGFPLIGVIHDPVNKNTYKATYKHGAFLNNKPLVTKQKTGFTLICDRSFTQQSHFLVLTNYLKQKHETLTVLQHGGAAMNAMWALENSPAIYLKPPKKTPGGGSLWDFAASVCIYNELGLFATNYYGHAIQLNNPNTTFMNEKGIVFTTKEKIHLEIKALLEA